MSDAWQPDDNPFPRCDHPARPNPPPRAVLHNAKPLTSARPQGVRREEHDGACVVGVAWAFLIEALFFLALGWAIAALGRAALS